MWSEPYSGVRGFILQHHTISISIDPGIMGDEVEGIMRASGTPIIEVGEHKRPRSLVYDLARFLASPFSYDVVGYENIQIQKLGIIFDKILIYNDFIIF